MLSKISRSLINKVRLNQVSSHTRINHILLANFLHCQQKFRHE